MDFLPRNWQMKFGIVKISSIDIINCFVENNQDSPQIRAGQNGTVHCKSFTMCRVYALHSNRPTSAAVFNLQVHVRRFLYSYLIAYILLQNQGSKISRHYKVTPSKGQHNAEKTIK